MADNYLITGYWGEPHVTTENDRGINAATFGTGRFVLPVGEEFAAELIGGNTVRMYDGKLMDNGAAAGIPVGEYVDLLIANAGQGMNRNDLIVFQYEQDSSTLIESGSFVVVQGDETTGTAVDPVLTQKDLLSGKADFDQMALWRVSVSGATISAPVKVFDLWERKAEVTADEIGAVKKSGDTMTGDTLGLYNNNARIVAGEGAMFLEIRSDKADSTNHRRLRLFSAKTADIKETIKVQDTINGEPKQYTVLHSGNFADYGVNKAGDTMTGSLNVVASNSGGRAALVAYSSNGYAVFLNRLDSNHAAGIRIYPNTTAATDALIFNHANGNSSNTKNYKILHAGHKPSASYTGNGSTATRSIAIGGTGVLLYVDGIIYYAFIGPNGGAALDVSGNAFGIPNAIANFKNGVLTIASNAPYLNTTSTVYNCQVL